MLFCVIVLLAVGEARKSYNGYKVVRLQLNGTKTSIQKEVQAVHSIADMHHLDIWATSTARGWVDIMIPPHLTTQVGSLFPGRQYTVTVADVQKDIDENERQSTISDKPDDIFSKFQPYSAISAWLVQQQQKHPTLAQGFVLGQSYEKNNINGILMSADSSFTKPLVYIECGIHAREWITPPHCLWFIDQILNEDPVNGPIILGNLTIAVVPVLNVDGYMYTFSNDRMWRKNRQPNERSNCVGTDLNRNWGYRWAPGSNPCDETYPGVTAFTGPETNAVKNFLAKFKTISFWDFHSYGGLWMSPWAYTCDEKPKDYAVMLAEMAASAAAVKAVNGNEYEYGDVCDVIYQASGSTCDFAYGTGNVIHSYGVETSGNSFVAPISDIIPLSTEIWAGVKTTLIIITGGKP